MNDAFLDAALIERLIAAARTAPRRRSHHLLHRDQAAAAQRLLVAMEPDSYVRPHCHLDPAKAETLIVLRGRIAAVVFDAAGQVLALREMAAGSACFGYDLQPGVFHSLVALSSGSVFLEVKAGPYAVPLEAEWGRWAPAEGDAGAAEYLAQLRERAGAGSAGGAPA